MEETEALTSWLQQMIGLATRLQLAGVFLLTGFFFAYFAAPFFPKKRRGSFLLPWSLYSGLMLLLQFLPEDLLPTGTGTLLRIFGGFLFLYLTDRHAPYQKFFLSLTFSSLMNIAAGMTGEQNWFLSDALYIMPSAYDPPRRVVALYFASQAEYLFVYALLLLIFVKVLHKAITVKREELTLRDLLFLSIPSAARILQGFLYVHYYGMYSDYFTYLAAQGDDARLSGMTWNSWLRFFDYTLAFIFLAAFIFLFYDIKRISNERVQDAVLREQTAHLMTHAKRIEEVYDEVRSLRHDMNHHVAVLHGLLENDNEAEAKAYLSRLSETLSETRPAVQSGHPVTDVLLSEELQRAEEKGVSFTADLQYPAGRGIDVFDLSAFLGNALSNAVTACEAGGDVAVRSLYKQNMYLVEVRNTFNGVLDRDSETGFPRSTKEAPGHGLGLLNMQKLAKKYGGDIVLEVKDGEAVLTGMFQTKAEG